MSVRRILISGALAFLVLAVVAAVVGVDRMEDRLERAAAELLDDRGYADVVVRADGRSLVVARGTDATVVSLLEDLDGVRSVRYRDPDASATSTTVVGTTSLPTTSVQPSTTLEPGSTTTVPSPTTTVPSSTTTTAPVTTTEPLSGLDADLAAALGLVEFELDDPDEPTPPSKVRLDAVAAILLEHPVRVAIVGHVATGTALDGDDAGLSLDRAWAVAGYLEWRGVPFDRVDVSGAGDGEPLVADPSDSVNERIEIRVVEGA
jgi:outer membrane protein OmpA-like peptidoglycan-associated protein